MVVPTITAAVTGIVEQPAFAARTRATKYAVCHRTNAIKNPYRLINVAWSSVNPDGAGHDNPVHDGPVFDVANPAATHGTTPRDSGLGSEAGGGNDRWGDIFYAYRSSGNGQNNQNNWTTAGQAIFNGATFTYNGVTRAACRSMSTMDYLRSERDANPSKPMAEMMADLDDQEAGEDAALKKALGGSFVTWFNSCNPAVTDCENLTSIITLLQEKSPSVTTEAPTNVSNTTVNGESATLNGTITPQGQSSIWYFEFDDDPNLESDVSDTTNVQEVPGTPGTSTSATTATVSYNATGLLSGTTYYYRTVLVVTVGTGDAAVETFLYGVVRSFSFGLPGSPVISGVTCGNTTLSVVFTAGSGSGVTNYDWSIDGGATWTTRSPASTSSPISLTGLVNGTAYDVSIRARTSTGTGLDSNTVRAIPCGSPSAVTDPPSGVSGTVARIHGNLTGNGNPLSTIRFVWGISPTLTTGNTTTAANVTTLAGTASAYPVFLDLSGLTPGATYYYKVVGTYGSSQDVEGLIEQFVVPSSSTTSTTTSTTSSTTSSSTTSSSTTTSTTTTTSSTSTSTVPPSSSSSSTTSSTSSSSTTTSTSSSTTSSSTTSTTTVPSTSTTVAVLNATTTTVAANGQLGRVIGTAWFDLNKDDRYQSNEPLLRGIDVQLVPKGVAGQSLGGRVRKQAHVMRTDSSGVFNFEDLEPGDYVIKSVLPGDYGITRSWDSSGNSDWQVTVTVYARKTSRGDFAAIGDVSSIGCVASATDGTVSATWSGFDQKTGTVDDTKFTATINPDCSFTLDGVPTGRYDVVAKARSGRVYASSAIRIARDGGVVSAGRLRMEARIVKVLPTTGSRGQAPMGVLAAALLAAGAATSGVVSVRRRRAATR